MCTRIHQPSTFTILHTDPLQLSYDSSDLSYRWSVKLICYKLSLSTLPVCQHVHMVILFNTINARNTRKLHQALSSYIR